jgi:hypothetical protein
MKPDSQKVASRILDVFRIGNYAVVSAIAGLVVLFPVMILGFLLQIPFLSGADFFNVWIFPILGAVRHRLFRHCRVG